MIQIKQEELQKALLQYYTNELKDALLSIFKFEQKYEMNLEAFKIHQENLEEEDFQKWDDLMEWESDVDYRDFMWKKIKAVENGDFEITE